MKVTKLFTLVCAIILVCTLLLTSCGTPTVSGPEKNNDTASKNDSESESESGSDTDSSASGLTADQWKSAFDLSSYNSLSISLKVTEDSISTQSTFKYKDGSIYVKHTLTENGVSEEDEFITVAESVDFKSLNPHLEELMYELESAEGFGFATFSYSEQAGAYSAKIDLQIPQTDVKIFFNGTKISKITLNGKVKINEDAAKDTSIDLTLEISGYNSTTLPTIDNLEQNTESDTSSTEKPSTPSTDEEKYNSALSLIAENNYAEAMEILASLKTYAPAQEKLKNFFWAPRTVSTRWKDSDNIEAGGSTVTYTYDSMGNVLSATEDDETIEYTYDAKGNRLTEKSSTDELTYTYSNGKLAKIEGSISTTTYEYNDKGLVSKITVTIDDGTDRYSHETTYEYTYYSNNTVKSIFKDNYFEYRYSESGVLEDLIGYSDYAAKTADFSLTPSFGSNGIASIEMQAIYGESASVAYTYDASGRLKKIEALTYQDEELTFTYTFAFDEYMLCYSENPASAEEIERICYISIDAMYEAIM